MDEVQRAPVDASDPDVNCVSERPLDVVDGRDPSEQVQGRLRDGGGHEQELAHPDREFGDAFPDELLKRAGHGQRFARLRPNLTSVNGARDLEGKERVPR
jgi:hypothetical protein